MINKQVAVKPLQNYYPNDYRGWAKPDLNKAVADADAENINDPFYVALGDAIQGVIVVLIVRGEKNLADNVLAEIKKQYEDGEEDRIKVGKLITGNKWAKRVANKDIAKALACQIESGKPCTGKPGCATCGG